MRTQFFHCDICRTEIKGKIAVFMFNDVLVNEQFQQVPVKKQADLCEACADQIVKTIDEMQKVVKDSLNFKENENHPTIHPDQES